MRKERQEILYAAVGQALTAYMKKRNIKASQLARAVGEQYNTIVGIASGKLFSFHHLQWMIQLGDFDIYSVIDGAIQSKEGANGKEENEITKPNRSGLEGLI